jgi:predicted ATPase
MTWEANFVGRDKELKKLTDGVEQARNGHGNLIFIVGEAGVGKSRLVQELSKSNTKLEFEFIKGVCIYHEGTDPYLPFIDMFKGYLSTHPYMAKALQSTFSPSAAAIFDFYSIEKSRYSPNAYASIGNGNDVKDSNVDKIALKNKTESGPYTSNQPKNELEKDVNLSSTTDITKISLQEGRNRMYETVSRMIINISKRKPLVIFLDDLNWADSATLHLLHYLARNFGKHPIFIIGAYRQEDLDYTKGQIHPLQELISRLATENLYNSIELDCLTDEDSIKIVTDLLEVDNVPIELAELIYKDTEGNPFFIIEVLRTLIDDGAIIIEDGNLILNISPDEIIIPTSIKEMINFRKHRLDDEYIDVLEYAAVIGFEFNLELLKNIMDIPETKLINILSKLVERKFITDVEEAKGLCWQFTHNKTHEVIYNEINENKKKLIHLRVAKHLEEVNLENIEEVVYNLAYHFYYGVDYDCALSYAIEGGEKAMRSYATKRALDLYNIGLNSLRLLDEKLANTPHYKEKKIEVLSQLATLNKTTGDWDKALNYYEQVLPISDEIKDKQIKSNTLLDIGWLYLQRNYCTEAEKYFNKSLKLAEKIKDQNIIAEAYQGLGSVFEREGDFTKAIENFSISRKFADMNQDVINLARVHIAFGRIYNIQGNYAKAIKHKEKSIYIFEKVNDLPELAKAYNSLGLTYYDMGEVEKNIEFNEKCIELADKISDIRIKGFGLTNTVGALVKSDQLDKALSYTTEALEIFQKLEEFDMIAQNYMNFGLIFKQKKDWDQAISNFKKAIDVMEHLESPKHLEECYRQFAEVYESRGEPKKASYYKNKAISVSKNMLKKSCNGKIPSYGLI